MKHFTFFCFLMMGLSLMAQQQTVIFPRESSWRYLDDGSNQGTAWKEPTFLDLTWASGQAELGYGDVQTTTVGFGPDANNKYPTTYFRTTFNNSTLPAAGQQLVLRLKRDDGAVVYLNGTEVFRVNMAAGPVGYLDYATATVDGSNESTFFEDTIPSNSLITGPNTIAVEIHQRSGNSSDISFDLELAIITPAPLSPPVDCSNLLDSIHISQFTSVLPSAQPDSLRIPSTHTFQLLITSGVPYTDPTQGQTRGLFDFTGYVPINGSSHNGYLSINHENGSSPDAGVSMLSLELDSALHVWNVTESRNVDFGPAQGTGRNCSGTVTPWNTIITAEETLPSSDANGDGYQDIGWLVEIDPVTASLVDYNNDGQPDKIWRAGRMSHENCVISPIDQKTLYEGNDENPGYIFKYVMDEPQKPANGSLYVLKLDGPINSTTTGSWIGIPNFTAADCNNVRSFAASVGGTNFDSVEDVEISPKDGKIYFTSKASSRVYRFKDDGNTVSQVQVFVGNTDSSYVIETETGLYEEQWGGGVDNLTFDDEGNLYVIQDGARNHIWMVPFCHTQDQPAVKLFAVTPAGCEPTGMTFSPDYRFMFVSIQHPSATNMTEQIDATGTPVKFDKESAIVIARKEFLGPNALPFPSDNLGLNSIEDRMEAAIYPNPTTGKVNVQINSQTSAMISLRVTDLSGRTVRVINSLLNPGENTISLDFESLPAGVYQATIYNQGQALTKNIIKQ